MGQQPAQTQGRRQTLTLIANSDSKGLPGWTWTPATTSGRRVSTDSLLCQRTRSCPSPAVLRTADGFQLGAWVNTQRNQFEEGSFDPGRQRRLEELPGWAWNARDARSEEGFSQLKRYGARPPQTYVTPEGYPLGKWAARQRQWRAEDILDADRVRRLEELPGWTWDAIHDARWEAGYDHLLDYVKEYGDALVPLSYEAADGYRLGAWISQQRLRYGKNTLDADRVHRLEEVRGWVWNTVVDKWPEGFSRLQAYVELYGDALVPQSYVDDEGYRLGAWISQQRLRYGKNTLDADRVHRLEEVRGWVWNTVVDKWPEGSVDCRPTSSSTVMLLSRNPMLTTRGTASVAGSAHSAPFSGRELLLPIVTGCSKNFLAGYGRPRVGHVVRDLRPA